MIASYSDLEQQVTLRAIKRLKIGARGFTIPELLVSVVVAMIIAAVAMPLYTSVMSSLHMNGTAVAITGAVSRTRYQAVMTSQTYTLAITTPVNTYVVKNLSTGVSAAPVPLPNPVIAINGGSAGTYTFMFNPNGTVTGAGGGAIPAVALTYQGRETDITVSGVGNVTTKIVH